LKIVSLVLEVTGFSFTFIEVIFPAIADRIENRIDRFCAYVTLFVMAKLSFLSEDEQLDYQERYTEERLHYRFQGADGSLYEAVTIDLPDPEIEFQVKPKLIVPVFSFLSSVFVFLLSIALDLPLIFPNIYAISVLMFTIIVFFPTLLALFNRLTNDSALGAFGLFVSFVGLSVELIDFF
jgi:hypothetical protein